MGRKAFWIGDRQRDIIELELDELCRKYPQFNRNHLNSTQKYWRNKMERQPQGEDGQSPDELKRLSDAFKEAGLNFTPDDLAQADRAGFHMGYIRNAEGEIEYTKPLPHVDFGGKNKNKQLLFEPVQPAIIMPNKGKIPKRDHNIIFVFSDAQIGYRRIEDELVAIHDESAINAALKLANDLKPNYLVDCGDTTDFAELSRYPVDSTHFQGTLQPSLQRTHDMFAEFTAATPGAERHTVGSNHVKRLGDFVLRNAFPLAGITPVGEQYPALSYPGILKLDNIGWQFHDGYGSAEYEYKDDLAFIHGTFAVSNGSTANKLSKANYGRNIVQGHKHSIESHYHTDRKGRQFGAFVVGALCRTDGYVPSFHSSIDQFGKPLTHYENWQNGILIIEDYGDGKYVFNQIPIHNGKIYWRGRTYDGNS